MLYPKKMSCKNYGLAINYDNETNIIPKKKSAAAISMSVSTSGSRHQGWTVEITKGTEAR